MVPYVVSVHFCHSLTDESSHMTCRIPSTFGNAIPGKATFFTTYIMVDGWSGLAFELTRLFPLVYFHARAAVFLRTEKDLDKATPAGNVCYETVFPQLGLYFLLGLVYATSSPLILPFLIFFFGFGYIIYRHQVVFSAPSPCYKLFSINLSPL